MCYHTPGLLGNLQNTVQDLSRRKINSKYKDVFLSPKSTFLIKHKPLFFTKPCQITNFFSTAVHVTGQNGSRTGGQN